MKIILRPHHLLCLNFFIGKGYSEKFVKNMTFIKEELNNKNPLIIFNFGKDSICRYCPNFLNRECSSENKVKEYDQKVIDILDLKENVEYRYLDINKQVKEKILTKFPLKEICINCEFIDICYKFQKNYLNY